MPVVLIIAWLYPLHNTAQCWGAPVFAQKWHYLLLADKLWTLFLESAGGFCSHHYCCCELLNGLSACGEEEESCWLGVGRVGVGRVGVAVGV